MKCLQSGRHRARHWGYSDCTSTWPHGAYILEEESEANGGTLSSSGCVVGGRAVMEAFLEKAVFELRYKSWEGDRDGDGAEKKKSI